MSRVPESIYGAALAASSNAVKVSSVVSATLSSLVATLPAVIFYADVADDACFLWLQRGFPGPAISTLATRSSLRGHGGRLQTSS